jgi:hypothetical protein
MIADTVSPPLGGLEQVRYSVSFRKSLPRSWASVATAEALLTIHPFGSRVEPIGTPQIPGVVLALPYFPHIPTAISLNFPSADHVSG